MGEKSEKLGQAIQTARQNAGITQQELCNRADLSYSTLAKIERGAIKTPSVFTVYRIAEVLGLSMDELLGSVVDAKEPAHTKRTSKSGISFVFFDVNGCLVRLFNAAFTQLAIETGVPSDRIESAFWHYNDAVCRGDMSMDEFNKNLAKQMGIASVDWNSYYLNAVESVPEMRELVLWTAKNYKIGLLSNIMPGQIEAMITSGILPDVRYDAIIESPAVKAIKPESEIYDIAQAKAGAAAAEILLVDDTRTNLMAAEHQSWKVLWFDDFNAKASSEKIRTALEF